MAASGSHGQVRRPLTCEVEAEHSCSSTDGLCPQRGGVERMRREAQLAAMRYDEERQKNRSLQRDNASGHAKVRTVPV